MSLPAGYAELLALSQNMLALAKKQEWDALAEAETIRAQMLPGLPRQPASLGPIVSREIADILRQIQAIDQEVLDYVMPWREHAAALLSRLESPQHRPA